MLHLKTSKLKEIINGCSVACDRGHGTVFAVRAMYSLWKTIENASIVVEGTSEAKIVPYMIVNPLKADPYLFKVGLCLNGVLLRMEDELGAVVRNIADLGIANTDHRKAATRGMIQAAALCNDIMNGVNDDDFEEDEIEMIVRHVMTGLTSHVTH